MKCGSFLDGIKAILANSRRSNGTARRRGVSRTLWQEQLELRCLLDGDIVISEIMYHPLSEDVRDEWIELHNKGTQPENLLDYSISRGVDFTFPDIAIPADGYLIVAADVERFQESYPTVTDVVGPWSGRLSNTAEDIEIENAAGDRIDIIEYADSGQWAQRRRGPVLAGEQGWVWQALHDGGGRTLELINTSLSNDYAHNWDSSAVEGGTPGAANSVVASDIAPVVLDVSHSPIIPASSDPVTVSARLVDEQSSISASVFYRPSTEDPGPFIGLEMFDDGNQGDGVAGDGVFAATIPAQPEGTIVELYIQATDAGGLTRTEPGPTDDNGSQEANILYQVDDQIRPDDVPLYRSIMTVNDWERFDSMNRRSDAQMNATFVATIGGETDVRYNVGIRYRGSGTRTEINPTNNRVNFPGDRPWLGTTQVNINANNPDNQIAGSAIFAMAGLPAADAFAVHMLHNGADLKRGRYYTHLEVLNSDWASRQLPLDSAGNVYRGRRANESPPGGRGAGLQYFGDDPAPYVSYLKGTNASDRDWSDVINLTRTLNNTPDEVYLEEVAKVMDIDQWLRVLALIALTDYNDGSLVLGDPQGDDYAMYRGIQDTRFKLIPYDLDSMFTTPTRGIFRATGNPALNRLLTQPEILPRFYAQFVNLMDTVLREDEIRPVLEQMLGDVVAPSRIDAIMRFFERRVQYVNSQIPMELTATSGLSDVGDVPTTKDDTSGRIRGEANAVNTRSVRVNGEEADWNARRGTWEISGVSVRPGMNRIIVEAGNEKGDVMDRTTLSIFRDTATPRAVPRTISEQTTWTAAESPYRVSGSVTVSSDATLTVEPGTTVFFDSGARLRIRGRLLAEGTEQNPIWFTRAPGDRGVWNGIQFVRSMQDNRISHAVIEHAETDDGMIGLDNSSIVIEHTRFDHTRRRRIRTMNSSLVVRNSEFTDIAPPGQAPLTDNFSEHVWGSGIPADGQFILENNVFGHITGHNDAIDFDAPRLPNPIPQILNNVFAGGGDDALDMTGDVYVEGNIFRNYIKDEFNTDPGESNTISASAGDFTVVRNVFENVQHASLIKEQAFMTFVNNTVIGATRAALYFDLPGQTTGPGRGATIDSSIFADTPTLLDMVRNSTQLTLDRSIVPPLDVGRGEGNLSVDPRVFVADGDYRLRPGSPATGAGTNGLDMGARVPSGAFISGEPSATTVSRNATLRVNGPAITHYRYRVNDGPYSEEAPIEAPIQLSNLTDGSYTVLVIGRNDAGVWQDESAPTVSKTWTVDSTLKGIIINEVLASNATAYEHLGTFPDVIELYNPGVDSVSLAGMSLTDDNSNPRRYVFPSGTTIDGGEFLVLLADDGNSTLGIHLGFALSSNGEGVYLYDRQGDLMDSVDFGMQITDRSIGRRDDGTWTLNQPSLGGPNQETPLGDPKNLQINEWLVDAEILLNNDFIELYNGDTAPVSLSGLFISDKPRGWPNRHEIAGLSFIEGNGLAVLTADGDPQDGADHVSFRLARQFDMIGLFDADLRVIDAVRYPPQFSDVSEGRSPNGNAELASFDLPTPGFDNPGTVDRLVPLVEIEGTWKFEQSGTDLGTQWRAPDFDDSSWEQGAGLLYVENEALPAPKNTRLRIGQPTYYFRTEFDLAQDPADVLGMNITTVVDDGAVIYVNGHEVLRVGMPEGEIRFDTLARSNVNEAQFAGPFKIPTEHLVPGRNVLAVEVHQRSLESTDIVFGLALDVDATIDVTGDSNDQRVWGSLRITELMYNPIGGSDFEFIELQNIGEQPINLRGVRIEDGIEFVFPEYTLQPEQFVAVVNDLAQFQSRYGTGIPVAGQYQGNLSNGGEPIRLRLAEPNPVNILNFAYDDAWVSETDGGGFSLVIDDVQRPRSTWSEDVSWRRSNFVSGSPGTADSGLGARVIVINEILAHTHQVLGDQIELHNTTGGSLNLRGWYLSDDGDNLTKYQIPDNTVIPAGGYLVLSQQTHFGASFELADHGGQVHLASPDAVGSVAGFQESVDYGAADAEVTIGRFVRSDELSVDYVQQATSTLGDENAGPRVGPVIINEIMYNPASDREEYVELRNLSETTISLFDQTNPGNKWRLSGSVEFTFPADARIEGSGIALVTGSDPNAFRAAHGLPSHVPIYGPYVGSLDDDGGDVQLIRPGEPDHGTIPAILVDRVQYDVESPWPPEADGLKASLNRSASGGYGNDVVSWSAGIADGTPGRANVPVDVTPPSIPTGLTVDLLAGPRIVLSWIESVDADTSIEFYRIYRDGQLIGTSETTEFVDEDFELIMTYEYKVSAVNRQGLESDLSVQRVIRIMGIDSVVSRFVDKTAVTFSEPVSRTLAENTHHYSIDRGVQVLSAVLGSDLRTVTLTTTPLKEFSYQLTVDGVQGAFGSQFPPEFNLSFEFVQGVSGFTVRGVKAARGSVRSILSAETLLNREPDDSRVAAVQTLVQSTLNFADDDGQAKESAFDRDRPFPTDSAGDDDDFVIQASGIIDVPRGEAGDWTFGINLASSGESTDGARLRVDGRDIIVAAARSAAVDRFGKTRLSEGIHFVNFLFFERDEGSAIELFAAPGAYTEFSATNTWRLVGDTASGGLTVVTDPLPPTEIAWRRAEPAAGLIFQFTDTRPIAAGDAALSYVTSLTEGQQLSVAATALQPDAQLRLLFRDPSGNRTVAEVSGPGQTVGLSDVRAVSDGDYRLEISSDADAEIRFEANLNTSFELETIDSASSNDTIATAQSLASSALDLGGGVRRMAVQGRTDGVQLVQARSGSVFAGNNLTFTFRNVPESGGEDVTLVVAANADLDGTNEYLGLEGEGVLTDELFVHDGRTQGSSTTSMTITSEQLAALTADGRATFTVTPSDEVSDFGATQLSLALRIGAAAGDHFEVAMSQDEVATFALTGLSPGDITMDVISSQGQVVARGVSNGQSGRQVIPGFRAPHEGIYLVRVYGEPQVDYSLVLTVGATFDVGPDDSIEAAPDITHVAAVLGAVDGATDIGDEPAVTTRLRTFPYVLSDGDGFQWDIQNDGSIAEGSDGAFNGGLRDFRFFVFDPNTQVIEDDGREVVLGPLERFDVPGVEVTRKIFVPEDQSYARFLEIFSNTSNAAASFTLDINTNLGSDARTRVGGTSSGDAAFDFGDTWLVTDDDDRGRGAPAITHVFAGPDAEGLSQAFLFSDSVSYSYDLTLEPGQTQIIMYFAAQSDTQAEAITKAQLLTELNLDALQGLSEAERSQIVNFKVQDLADYYAIQVNEGDRIVIRTETPQVGAGSLANRLDPRIRLFDSDGQLVAEDDNSAEDGRNASLRLGATESGTYTVSVTAAQGSGQYVLRTVGSTATAKPMTVIDSVPGRDASGEGIPHSYTVRLSSNVDVTSVSNDDLLINGRAALDVYVVDGDSIEFLIDPAIDDGQGSYSIQIAAGSFSSVSGQPVDASSTTFFLDTTPPRVTSTTWNGASLPEDRTLPVGSLQLSVELDEELSTDFLGPEDVLISNQHVSSTFQPFGVFFDEPTNSVSANFQPIPEGDYVLTLSSRDEGFEDAVGNDLDGEPSTTTLDGTVTGDGVDGGDYSVSFRIDDEPLDITHRFQSVEPLGSFVRKSESTDTISFPRDVDTFNTYLVAGEILDLLLEPLSQSNTMSITVRQPSGGVMMEATATSVGGDVYLPRLPIAQSGQYSIAVTGDEIGGDFRLTALRNAAMEAEDTAAEAPLNISNTFVDLGAGRFAVVGTSEGRTNAVDIDEFTVDLTGYVGQSIDIVLSGLNDLDLSKQQLQLFAPDYSSVLATGTANGERGVQYENLDLGILDFVVPRDGVYPVRITSSVAGEYSLIVTSGATFDTEPNGDIKGDHRALTANSVAFGHSSASGGLTVVEDPEGDQFGQGDFQPDINRVTAQIDEDTVTLGVHFHGSFVAEDSADQLFVLFELDVDQDPSTGQPPIQDQFAADAGQGAGALGVDKLVQIAVGSVDSEAFGFDPEDGTSFTPETTHGDTFIEVHFPLLELDDDDASFNFGSFLAVVNGQDVEVTDVAPARRFVTASGVSPEASGDFYQLTLTAGQTVKIETSTPFDLPAEAPVNTLDPTLRLLSQAGENVLAMNDNSASDGRNAVLFHTSTDDESLLVHVVPEDGSGEYVLSVTTIEGIPGDSNRDGRFDQLDLVQVLQAGLYLTGRPATFEQGDWNGDGVFDPLDIVTVLNARTGPSAFAATAQTPHESQK